MDCQNPECNAEDIDTGDDYGGNVICPKCHWHHDTSYDTNYGLYIDGPCGPKGEQ